MRFATYLPYDWQETTREKDAYGQQVGKELIYCISADTVEDFILGSMSIEPVCPEQLIVFEVKHFYWIDKIQHYLFLDGGLPADLISSRNFVTWLSKQNYTQTPYQDFIDYYYDELDKTKFEFLVPKNRLVPIKTFDIKKVMTDLYITEDVNWENSTDWNDFKQKTIEERIKTYHISEHTPLERAYRNLDADVCFQNFILNPPFVDVANDICNTQIDMDDVDDDIFNKLWDKFNKNPSEQRLEKLIKYCRTLIRYK